MKKASVRIIALSLILGLLTGCGAKEKPGNSKPIENKPIENKNTEQSKPSSTQVDEAPGTELSTFMGGYSNTKNKVWEAMSKKFEEDQNLAFTMGSLGFAFADLAIIDILLFDSLTVKEGDTFKGKLMFSGIDAWKKVKGDIIEFGYDFTYKEDKNNNKNGDREVTNGKFDKKNNTLYYERVTERDSKKISRIVVEIVRNSDKSYSSQIIFSDSQSDDNAEQGLSGYMTWFEGEDIISILTEQKTTDINFNYNSILSKKNAKPEEMAKGMQIVSKASFIRGAASFEQAESK